MSSHVASIGSSSCLFHKSHMTAKPNCFGCWLGRPVYQMKNFFVEAGNGLEAAAKKVIRVFGKFSMDSCSIARFCRLGITAFAVIEKGMGVPGIFTLASNQFASAEGMIYTISVGSQIKYFGAGDYKQESILRSLGEGWLLAAGIAGFFVFLGEVALVNFAKIGQAIGSIPILGEVTKWGISFGQVVCGAAAVGFGFLIANNAIKLSQAKTTQEKVQSAIDLVWMMSEATLATYCATGTNNLAAFAFLATVSAGLGIASFAYDWHVKDQSEAKKLSAGK
jgi:hypothetical protein